jgi:hypothetical protein
MISGSLLPRHDASLGLRMEERPTIWRVAANVSNKQSRAVEKVWPPVWGLGEVLTTPRLKTDLVKKRIHVPRAWTYPLVSKHTLMLQDKYRNNIRTFCETYANL